jgi:hypothetical protein
MEQKESYTISPKCVPPLYSRYTLNFTLAFVSLSEDGWINELLCVIFAKPLTLMINLKPDCLYAGRLRNKRQTFDFRQEQRITHEEVMLTVQ